MKLRYSPFILFLFSPSVFFADALPCFKQEFDHFANVRWEKDQLRFCREKGEQCFAVDSKTGIFTSIPGEEVVVEKSSITVEADAAGKVKACFDKACYKLSWDASISVADVVEGVINADKTVGLIQLKKGPATLVTYDLARGKEITRMSPGEVAAALDIRPDQLETITERPLLFQLPATGVSTPILAAFRPCVRPCGWAVLIDPVKKKRIAFLGGGADRWSFFLSYRSWPVRINGDLYGVLEGTAERIILQNLRTGKMMGEISLRDETKGMIYWDINEAEGRKWPRWNMGWMLFDGKGLVVLLARAPGPKALIIDPTKRVINKSWSLHACEK